MLLIMIMNKREKLGGRGIYWLGIYMLTSGLGLVTVRMVCKGVILWWIQFLNVLGWN